MRRLRRRMTAVLTALLLLTLLIPWGLAEPALGPTRPRCSLPMISTPTSCPWRGRTAGSPGGYARLASATGAAAGPSTRMLLPWTGETSPSALWSRPSTPPGRRSCGPWALWVMTPRLRATMSLTTLAWALPRCSRRPTPAEIRFRPCSWPTTPHRPVVLTSWTSSGHVGLRRDRHATAGAGRGHLRAFSA